MIDKLQQVEERFEKVNDLLCLPETVSDQNKYASLMKELKNTLDEEIKPLLTR